MAKKKRLKGDPFDWVESTAESSEHPTPDEQTPPLKGRKRSSGTAASKVATSTKTGALREAERTIYIKYRKDSGEIIAIQELMHRPAGNKSLPWLEIPEDMDAGVFDLTEGLLDKPIIDIHKNYRVSKSGDTVRLVLKS